MRRKAPTINGNLRGAHVRAIAREIKLLEHALLPTVAAAAVPVPNAKKAARRRNAREVGIVLLVPRVLCTDHHTPHACSQFGSLGWAAVAIAEPRQFGSLGWAAVAK